MPEPTHSRKYGPQHKRLRRYWQIRIAEAGSRGIPCARCGLPITSSQGGFDLGHLDGAGPDDYAGPEHIKCSRATVRHAREAANGNAGPAHKPDPGLPELCEHTQRGERHGKLCCGNSRDW